MSHAKHAWYFIMQCCALTRDGHAAEQDGVVWKHPNLRVAYVAQHAFHHVELVRPMLCCAVLLV